VESSCSRSLTNSLGWRFGLSTAKTLQSRYLRRISSAHGSRSCQQRHRAAADERLNSNTAPPPLLVTADERRQPSAWWTALLLPQTHVGAEIDKRLSSGRPPFLPTLSLTATKHASEVQQKARKPAATQAYRA
jgi:hypothetical protein